MVTRPCQKLSPLSLTLLTLSFTASPFGCVFCFALLALLLPSLLLFLALTLFLLPVLGLKRRACNSVRVCVCVCVCGGGGSEWDCTCLLGNISNKRRER